MQRSVDRILVTHTGSLPRSPELLSGPPLREAVADVVRRQVEAGIDIVSDGELSKPGFAVYVQDRLSGFSGPNRRRFGPRDLLENPVLAERLARLLAGRGPGSPSNDGPIAYVGGERLATDIDNLTAATSAHRAAGAFLPAASPGAVDMTMGTSYYSEPRQFLYALADALSDEYRTIVERGLTVQVDCPDLAMLRHSVLADATAEEFRRVIGLHVEALNHALEGIDEESVRVHVCWGNYAGPHVHDVPLRDILDVVYRVRASGISVEGANPRHEHEWEVFRERPLPEGRVLIPGVVDTCSQSVEHPELVAQRIERYAGVVGRENVIAGTDCGFGTNAGYSAVPEEVAWAKLAALAEGARLASGRLWS